MLEERGEAKPLVLRPAAVGDDPGAITRVLTGAFAAVRDACEDGRARWSSWSTRAT